MKLKSKGKVLRGMFLGLWVMVALGLLAGCGKPPAVATDKQPATDAAPAADSNATATVADAGPPAGEKICFACQGKGKTGCMAPGCVNGMVDCPGPCLKLDRGVWVHLDVAGHPPTDLWQKFYLPDGGYEAYSQAHVGHVIAMEGGKAVDTGPCKICGGSGKVPCPVCKGTGEQVCPICKGAKYIPATWTPTDNPWLDSQPDLLRLTSGQILFGKCITTNGDDILVKTRDGKYQHVHASDILPRKTTDGTM